MKRLKGGKPRRFRDYRRREAKRWEGDYDAIAGRYPPPDRLARELVALAADLLNDYRALRLSSKAKASARRKTAGLLLGALRTAADGAGGRNGHGTSGDMLERLRSAPVLSPPAGFAHESPSN